MTTWKSLSSSKSRLGPGTVAGPPRRRLPPEAEAGVLSRALKFNYVSNLTSRCMVMVNLFPPKSRGSDRLAAGAMGLLSAGFMYFSSRVNSFFPPMEQVNLVQ